VTYSGPEIEIAGLDQINLMLPKSLAGTGATTIVCPFSLAGRLDATTNEVGVTIR
jgi:hypothetical protein